jgi:hypothetical protein
MQNYRACRRSKSFNDRRFHPGVIALVIVAVLSVEGCGGGYSSTHTPTPTPQNAVVSGQLNLLLTSTSGHGTTNIYANITQTGTTFSGDVNTLVCPSNDLLQCQGNDASITTSGTVSGMNVTMMISFPSSAGTDTVTIVGTSAGATLAGTYTDSSGDTGTWKAFFNADFNGTNSGTFNSTSNPLPIAPSILFTLSQDASFHVTGSATIMNLPCISSLTVSGQAIGGALSLTDAANEAVIIAVPDSSNLNFRYSFAPTAAHCAGDVGRGTVTHKSPWDY